MLIIGFGLVGGYIGGSAANGWDFTPWDAGSGDQSWDWNSNRTWAGIGIGIGVGALAGWGTAVLGPMVAGTGFFSHFTTSGTVAAYALTGAGTMGAAGYTAGFSGGMLYSHGDLNYPPPAAASL